VTLALVAAWEGDVEAWHTYWAQIAELAKSESGTGKKKGAPTPPEPSIITPMRAEDAPEAGTADPDAEAAAADAETDEAAGLETAAATEGADARAEAVGGGAASTTTASEQEQDSAAGSNAASVDAPEKDETARAEAGPAQMASGPAGAGIGAAQPAHSAHAGAGLTQADSSAASAGTKPAQSERGEPSQPQPAASKPAASAAAASPRKKSALARAGLPALLFAVGIGVGAFGDHALNSKSPSNPQPASLPTVSHSPSTAPTSPARSTQTASLSSTTATTTSPSESSESSSPTATPGAPLGAYSNIQLASGYSVDFFNDTYHPVPGSANGPDTMGFFASSFVDGRFYADRVAILDPQDTGTFAACRNSTSYQHDVLLSQVSAGSSFCVHTTTGHLVLVTVRRMPSSTDANPYAVLDLTVWQDS
jgi:hypothetical protein